MAKRVSFYPVVQEKGNGDEEPLPKKSKHSLDSDDESDDEGNENYNIMDPDEFEGQEEGEIRREQDVTITPFNMNEELEEGHIDRDGMYIFKKEADQVTDHWLANIDSVQLKEPVPRKSSHESDAIKLSTNDCYRKMIDLVLPGETVKRAIQRLGRKGKKTFGVKNKKNLSETEVLEQENERAKMLELISVADQVLDAGDMDIYERTFEQLNFRLKQAEELSKGTDDMFAEPEDEKPETQVSTESVVTWLLKWEDKEDTEIHGPFTNDQMIQWCSSGYFDKGAWVQQVGKQDYKFYSTRRIDFELYS